MVKKRLVKSFNVSNRLSYTIIAVVALILVAAGVYAATISPPNPGHSLSTIKPDDTGCEDKFIKWTAAGWACETPVSSLDLNQLPSPIIRRVFVTSTTYNGNLGGISGADAKCQGRADAASLGGHWRALISSNTQQNMRDIIGTKEWYRLLNVNGVVVSERYYNSPAQMYTPFAKYDGTNYLLSPLNVNEFGQAYVPGVTVYAWTGSDYVGGADVNDCSHWTQAGSYTGINGLITTTKEEPSVSGSPRWYVKGTINPCSDALRLYCIED